MDDLRMKRIVEDCAGYDRACILDSERGQLKQYIENKTKEELAVLLVSMIERIDNLEMSVEYIIETK